MSIMWVDVRYCCETARISDTAAIFKSLRLDILERIHSQEEHKMQIKYM